MIPLKKGKFATAVFIIFMLAWISGVIGMIMLFIETYSDLDSPLIGRIRGICFMLVPIFLVPSVSGILTLHLIQSFKQLKNRRENQVETIRTGGEGGVQMRAVCPKCGAEIDAADINVAADIARCAACNEIFSAHDLIGGGDEPKLEPPAGTKIEFISEADERGTFRIPRRGFTIKHIVMIAFATFWISFVAFWTWAAAHGSILFACFSIPFWLVGLGMWYGIIRSMTERQEIEISTEALIVRKRSIISSSTVEIPYDEIERISVESVHQNIAYVPKGNLPHRFPTIFYGTKRLIFAEHVSEAEMRWMVDVVNVCVSGRIRK